MAGSSSISAISRNRTVTAGIWRQYRSGPWPQAHRAGRPPGGRAPPAPTVDISGSARVQAVEHVFDERDAIPRRQSARLLDQRFGLVAHFSSSPFEDST